MSAGPIPGESHHRLISRWARLNGARVAQLLLVHGLLADAMRLPIGSGGPVSRSSRFLQRETMLHGTRGQMALPTPRQSDQRPAGHGLLPGRKQNPPPPLEGLGREADQGWGEGSCGTVPLPPALVRFAAQALKGRGSAFSPRRSDCFIHGGLAAVTGMVADSNRQDTTPAS